jgi:hypothetical protein
LTLTTDHGSITVRKSTADATPAKEPAAQSRSQQARVEYAVLAAY